MSFEKCLVQLIMAINATSGWLRTLLGLNPMMYKKVDILKELGTRILCGIRQLSASSSNDLMVLKVLTWCGVFTRLWAWFKCYPRALINPTYHPMAKNYSWHDMGFQGMICEEIEHDIWQFRLVLPLTLLLYSSIPQGAGKSFKLSLFLKVISSLAW